MPDFAGYSLGRKVIHLISVNIENTRAFFLVYYTFYLYVVTIVVEIKRNVSF